MEPFYLLMPGLEIREGRWREGTETWRTLEVIIPPDFLTHSRKQSFYFDELRNVYRKSASAKRRNLLKQNRPGRNRTCDPLLRRQMLYPTELRARAAASLACLIRT